MLSAQKEVSFAKLIYRSISILLGSVILVLLFANTANAQINRNPIRPQQDPGPQGAPLTPGQQCDYKEARADGEYSCPGIVKCPPDNPECTENDQLSCQYDANFSDVSQCQKISDQQPAPSTAPGQQPNRASGEIASSKNYDFLVNGGNVLTYVIPHGVLCGLAGFSPAGKCPGIRSEDKKFFVYNQTPGGGH
jgi:hypothetical protein